MLLILNFCFIVVTGYFVGNWTLRVIHYKNKKGFVEYNVAATQFVSSDVIIAVVQIYRSFGLLDIVYDKRA